MPLYKVKPDRTVQHNNRCYFEGDVVEFASEFGAYHEPNIVPYVVPESIEAAVDVNVSTLRLRSESTSLDAEFEEDSEDEEEADQEEEKSPSIWYQ